MTNLTPTSIAVSGIAHMPMPTMLKPIASPKQLIEYHENITRLIQDALKKDTDYGTIPNTNKATLYKAGAERLCLAFGAHAEYDLVSCETDHDRKNEFTNKYGKQTSYGLYRYIYRCRIIKDGKTLGEGHGICSTLESKYISRPRDSENTACKMAQKRAFVAATLHAFGLSDRFTQDLEDQFQDEKDSHSGAKGAQPKPAQAKEPPAPPIFDNKNPEMLDWLEKRLIQRNIPQADHDPIALEMNGKPLTKGAFEEAIVKVTIINKTFAE